MMYYGVDSLCIFTKETVYGASDCKFDAAVCYMSCGDSGFA